jgi:hypothetical protein
LRRFAEASLAEPVELLRGVGSVVAATRTNDLTAAMKVGFEWYQAAWEEADEVKDRQDKQRGRTIPANSATI